MKLNRRTFPALLLLTLFLTYEVGVTMFTHIHYVSGIMVVHSHPFAHKSHSHTTKAFAFITHLGTFHSGEVKITECDLSVERPYLWTLTPEESTQLVFSYDIENVNLRAPPVC